MNSWGIRNQKNSSKVVALTVLLVALAGCASAPAPKLRLADGTQVPASAHVVHPKPLDELPLCFLSSIGSAGHRGQFRADLVVDATGRVSDVRVFRSVDPSIDAEIEKRLRQLTYMPASVDGKAVAALVKIHFKFTDL